MSSEKIPEPEYWVSRIAIRHEPPTFFVEYSQSSGEKDPQSEIYHIKMMIDGLLPTSDPSSIALALMEHCFVLRHSSSKSNGLKFSQIVRLCRELVKRKTQGIMDQKACYHSVQKMSLVPPLVSDETCRKKMISEEYIKENEQEYYSEHVPLPCVFILQKNKEFDVSKKHQRLSQVNIKKKSLDTSEIANNKPETKRDEAASRAVSNLIAETQRQEQSSIHAAPYKQDSEDAMKTIGPKLTVSTTLLTVLNNDSTQKKQQVQSIQVSPNNPPAVNKEAKLSKDEGRLKVSKRIHELNEKKENSPQPHQCSCTNIFNTVKDCKQRDIPDDDEHVCQDFKSSASRTQVVPMLDVLAERNQEIIYFTEYEDFEQQNQSYSASSDKNDKRSIARNKYRDQYSVYSEAFEEESLTTALRTYPDDANSLYTHKGFINKENEHISDTSIAPEEQIISSSSQHYFLPFRHQELWPMVHNNSNIYAQSAINTYDVNKLEQNSAAPSICTEIEILDERELRSNKNKC